MLFGRGAYAQTGSDTQIQASVLKALAGAPALASEAITTRTVDGTVTLSGSVSNESTRVQAENITANVAGVRKVVDELSLANNVAGAQSAPGQADPSQSASTAGNGNLVLQSDGTYAADPAASPAPGSAPATAAQRNDPDNDQALDQLLTPPSSTANGQTQPQAEPTQQGIPPYTGQTQAPYPSNPGASQQANNQYPGQPYPGQPYPGQQYPGQQYPSQPGYGQYPSDQQPYGRRPLNGYPQQPGTYPQNAQSPQAGYAQQPPPYGGQVGGQPVTIPSGSLLRVRLNRTLSSNRSQPGENFDGVVINDVIADGEVAIPRGATVQGKVVDSKASGTLKGRGELSVELTAVNLGGKSYPVTSDIWARNGSDKTIETIDKTAGFGAVGAGIGAIGGGGCRRGSWRRHRRRAWPGLVRRIRARPGICAGGRRNRLSSRSACAGHHCL